jgi:hypothetical protein
LHDQRISRSQTLQHGVAAGFELFVLGVGVVADLLGHLISHHIGSRFDFLRHFFIPLVLCRRPAGCGLRHDRLLMCACHARSTSVSLGKRTGLRLNLRASRSRAASMSNAAVTLDSHPTLASVPPTAAPFSLSLKMMRRYDPPGAAAAAPYTAARSSLLIRRIS